MRFRLSDEESWASEFDADDSASLARGIRGAWDARIAQVRASYTRSSSVAEPAFVLAEQIAWIDGWLAERMAREGARDDQCAAWTRQADHWRYCARRDLGGDASISPLRLHLWAPGPPSPHRLSAWVAFGESPGAAHAPRVARIVDRDRAERLWLGAEAMVRHATNLLRFAGAVAGVACDAARAERFPSLALLPSDEEAKR